VLELNIRAPRDYGHLGSRVEKPGHQLRRHFATHFRVNRNNRRSGTCRNVAVHTNHANALGLGFIDDRDQPLRFARGDNQGPHADTNVEMRTSTNDTGNYLFTNVPPGRYTLRASKEGFATKELSAFSLLVNQTATFDRALSVGQVTQTVNVEAGGARVQASTSELGTVVERQEVLNLPLNGRNFTELFLLTPGASPVDASQNGGGGLQNPIGQNVVPAMNGQLNRSNLYYLDGILDIEQQFNTYAVSPILDTLQEFKVDSHNDQAQFGQAMGGVVNMVTKSGTNKLHGSAWEFLRNNALDARNPFISKVTPFKQNQFGVTIGGPVVLPHYNGRNKTFFYAGYEGYRNHTANELLYRTATAANLRGDLSDLGVPIYNPFSTRSAGEGGFVRDVFPNNNISQYIDPGMLAFAKATFPAPVNTGVAGTNAINTDPYTVREDDLQVRVDERLGDKDYAFFRWSQRWQTRITPQQLLNLASTGAHRIHNYVGSETHTFGPGTVLQMEFGSTSDIPFTSTTFSPVPAGLPDSAGFVPQFMPTVSGLGRPIIPSVSIAGFLGGGESAPSGVYQNVYQGKADLTTVHGRHIFKMGFDLVKVGYLNGGTGMTVSFAALQTSNPAAPGGTGSALASFLLGVPNSGSLNNFSYRKHRHWVEGYYFQDQWKATNKLTVNFGVRYDLTKMPVAGDFSDGTVYSGDIDFDTGTYILQAMPPFCSAVSSGPCIPGMTLPDHVVVSPSPYIQKNTKTNFSPRLGLAYRLGTATALRGSPRHVSLCPSCHQTPVVPANIVLRENWQDRGEGTSHLPAQTLSADERPPVPAQLLDCARHRLGVGIGMEGDNVRFAEHSLVEFLELRRPESGSERLRGYSLARPDERRLQQGQALVAHAGVSRFVVEIPCQHAWVAAV